MTRLLDEEIEEDEAFWGQDALKEVSRLVLKLLIFFPLGFVIVIGVVC